MIATRHLPGIRFETLTPPIAEALPRMDIAVFIGFASSGPLQRAVAVESYAQFAELFGVDLPLVWDEEHRVMEAAFLGPAVRAFFANGGKRCWIVRVAGAGVVANSFVIPNLYFWDGSPGAAVPAMAIARAEGSWSDSVRVSTVLSSRGITVRPGSSASQLAVQLANVDELVIGDLLRITCTAPQVTQFAVVDEIVFFGAAGVGAARVQLASMLQATAGNENRANQWSSVSSLPTGTILVERLSFDMSVRAGETGVWRLTDLTFDARHPRFWGALPTDEDLFREVTSFAGPIADSNVLPLRAGDDTRFLGTSRLTDFPYADLWAAGSNPRFPIAGPGVNTALSYPIGMDILPGEPTGPLATALSALQRDGLANYTAELFLDLELIDTSAMTILQTADYLQYASGTDYRPTGIHTALRIEEATLIAVPDAVHRGWDPAPDIPLPVPEPSKPLVHADWWHFRDCPREPFPAVPEPEWEHFLNCGLRVISPPVLAIANPRVTDGFTLTWTAADPDLTFSLEESGDPAFIDTTVVYEGADRTFTFDTHPEGDWFYRIRGLAGGDTSDYSNGIVVRVQRAAGYMMRNSPRPALLLDVQRSLLRLCVARGDLFALLSVPSTYRTNDLKNHVWQLRSDVSATGEIATALTSGELDCLSYGALYHPWLFTRDGSSPLDFSPPDGAMCGVFAGRSLARGAWIAPANEALQKVIGLDPVVDSSDWQLLQDTQINLIRSIARIHTSWNEDTLSVDELVRPIHVRRLMQLIRRLTLRLGNTYVFEPNDDVLRRSVQRSFRSALQQMFQRGAFGGTTAEESYFVRMPSGDALDRQRDLGQLLVEIGVAPAATLTFLTVRLLQLSDGTLTATER